MPYSLFFLLKKLILNRVEQFLIFFILFFSWTGCLSLFAQDIPLTINTNNRGLVIPVQKISRSDSLKIDSLLNTGIKLQWQLPDSAISILKAALQESQMLNYSYGAAVALINTGRAQVGQGLFDESMKSYRQAYFYILRSHVNYHSLISALYIDMGVIYSFQDNYEKAFEYYYAVLQYMLKQPSFGSYNLIMVYNNISTVLISMEQYDKAAFYLEEGERLMQERRQKDIYSYIWVNKASLALTQKDYDTFELYQKKALQIAKQYNQTDVLQTIYLTEGEYYMDIDQPQKAIVYLKKAINTTLPTYSYYSVIAPYYNLGFAYYQLEDYKNAEKSLLTALDKANSLSVTTEKLKALNTLAAICEKTNRYQKALEYQKQYTQLKDSIHNKEKLKMANELEIKFRTAEKDEELVYKKLLIEKQNRELERKNLLVIGVIIGLLVVVFITIILFRNFRIRNKVMALHAKIEGEEEERSRIARELHDGLGGMLAVLKMKFSSYAGNDNRDETIVDLLNETSEEVRKTAHNLMPDSINNMSLEEALKTYVETINRSSQDLKIDLQIHTQLAINDSSSKLSLYRVLQEIIQNIVRHSKASLAIIQIFKKSSKIHLLIEDNGVGFDYEKVKKGLGLTNLETRVKMLNGKIFFNSAKGRGTIINIELNY